MNHSKTDAVESQPIFIIGLPRSGTTLLNMLMNRHAQIALMRECSSYCFPKLGFKLHSTDNILVRLNYFNQSLDLHQISLNEEVIDQQISLTRKSVCLNLYRRFYKANNACFGGEKSPSYIWCLSSLYKTFPEGKFIFILRPVHESLASYIRRFSFKSKGHQKRIEAMYLNRQEYLFRFLDTHQNTKNIFVCSYEELVNDTSSIIKNLCKFLQLPFQPEMCELADEQSSDAHLNKSHIGKVMPPSSKVAKKKHTSNPVESQFRERLDRYIIRWRSNHPKLQKRIYNTFNTDTMPPSWQERLSNTVLSQWEWLRFKIIINFFVFAPLSLIQRYRKDRA